MRPRLIGDCYVCNDERKKPLADVPLYGGQPACTSCFTEWTEYWVEQEESGWRRKRV